MADAVRSVKVRGYLRDEEFGGYAKKINVISSSKRVPNEREFIALRPGVVLRLLNCLYVFFCFQFFNFSETDRIFGELMKKAVA